MNNPTNEVKGLFDNDKLFIHDDFLTSRALTCTEFLSLFPVETYPSTEFVEKTGVGTVRIDELDFIFDDFHQLFTKVANPEREDISSEVLIISHGNKIVNLGDFPDYFRLWIDLLEKISDHQYFLGTSKINKAYIFVSKDSLNNSDVLDIKLDQVPSEKLAYLVNSISNPKLLLESCLQEDAHQGEKLAMMKTSIVELIEKNNLSFFELFTSAEDLLNNFHKNYETYLRSFSFDEFIKDLEDDVGDFISKVEEQIQGFYLQALAVPGAVILASALRGAEKNISLALIFSTVLALILVFRSLKSKTIFIVRITQNTLTKLSIYQRRTVDIANNFAKESIAEKIDAAVSSIKETSEKSKSEIERIWDIIVALIFLYAISAMVFGKL